MDSLVPFLVDAIPKIALFLLLFASVALVFEIFYFRKHRAAKIQKAQPVEPRATAVSFEAPMRSETKFKKRNLIIIGLLLILLILPISVFVVREQVRVRKEAQQVVVAIKIGCDQIDIMRNNAIVEGSLLVNDIVSFVGYCFVEGGSQNDTISKLRFTLTLPSRQILSPQEFLAFDASSKNKDNKRYFKATYPNFKLTETGSYKIELWGYNTQVGWSSSPFVRNFTVASSGTTLSPTPTAAPTPTLQTTTQTGNKAPTCDSLSAIPLTGPAPLTTSLTGTGSDSDGQVVAFEFTFGDGAKQTVNKNVGNKGSATTSHVYQTKGNYTATLRVRDNSGNLSPDSPLCSVTITVSESASAATESGLAAQPTKVATSSPTPAKLPEAGIELPMFALIGAGLILLTTGLLFAF